MAVIYVETFIKAPLEKCFDMARNIDIHTQTTSHTKERAVSGVTTGKIGLGESVTFEAKHFIIRQRLQSKIVDYNRPH